jgi:esterase/lipase superfamily enzyme
MEIQSILKLIEKVSSLSLLSISECQRFEAKFNNHNVMLNINREVVKVPLDDLIELTYIVYFSKSLKITDYYEDYSNIDCMLAIVKYLIENLVGDFKDFSKNRILKRTQRKIITQNYVIGHRRNTPALIGKQNDSRPKPSVRRAIEQVSSKGVGGRGTSSGRMHSMEGSHKELSSSGRSNLAKTGSKYSNHGSSSNTTQKERTNHHNVNVKTDQHSGFKSSRQAGFCHEKVINRESRGSKARTEYVTSTEHFISVPTIEEIKDLKTVQVHYATNRKVSDKHELYSGGTDDVLRYGLANISIPQVSRHKRGKVERPIRFFKEEKGKHFVIDDGEQVSDELFFKNLKVSSSNKRMILFIHGFNVTFKEALYQAAQIKMDLFFDDDPIMIFSWPSNGSLFSYSHDKESAIYSSTDLSNVLKKIECLDIGEILVIAHSMGAFCLAEAIKEADLNSNSFARLALAAPDIEQSSFIKKYSNKILSLFYNTSIYVSSTDLALIASRMKNKSNRVGETRGGIAVVDGMETIDMSCADKKWCTSRHSYSFTNQGAIMDLHQYLINGIEANKRQLIQQSNENNKIFWCFPKN